MSRVTESTRFCPECRADWRGAPIPEASRHLYGSNDGFFSRLIGVELPNYDGVSRWHCPDCATEWDRWTGKKES